MLRFKSSVNGMLFSLIIVLVCAFVAAAQSITGSISGTVTDSTGGVIPDATVTIIHEQTGDSRNVTTNDEGRFSFSAIQPGIYTVKVEQKGFQTLKRTNTTLSANENLSLGEMHLTAGNVSETVTV